MKAFGSRSATLSLLGTDAPFRESSAGEPARRVAGCPPGLGCQKIAEGTQRAVTNQGRGDWAFRNIFRSLMWVFSRIICKLGLPKIKS